MNEHLSIRIPPGCGSVQSNPDGGFQVLIPVGSLSEYGDLSREFIALGVGLMFRGRELHGDLRKDDPPGWGPDRVCPEC